MAWALAGSDLRGAQLPESLTFDLVKRVEDCSKSCQRIFLTILAAAFVCWLARLTTTDVDMVVGKMGAELPFIGVGVDVGYFYFLSPLLILLTYVYFHINLQILWACAVNLPVYFPDGLRIDKKVHPWALIRFSELLGDEYLYRSSSASKLRVVLTLFLFWVAVPASLSAYWLHYLNQHHLWVSLWHVLLIFLSFLVDSFFVWRIFELRIHSREERDDFFGQFQPVHYAPEISCLKKMRARWFRNALALAIVVAILAFGYTVAVVEFDFGWPERVTFLDFEGEILGEKDLRYENLRGANLRGADLTDVRLNGADLAYAKCDDETEFPDAVTKLVRLEDWTSCCRKRAEGRHCSEDGKN